MNTRATTISWLFLLALTALSVSLAETRLSGGAVLATVLIATMLKGRIVIDRFMALQGVGGPWRWVVLGWLVLVLGAIGFAFRASLN